MCGYKMRHSPFTRRVVVLFVISVSMLVYTYCYYSFPTASTHAADDVRDLHRHGDVLQFGARRYMKLMRSAYTNETTLSGGSSRAEELKSKVRVLCLILTIDTTFHTRATVVKATWARRCNKFFFVMKSDRHAGYIINSPEEENREHIVHKVKYALRYIYDRHMNEFDWLLKADDDTYVIVENLRHLLQHYDSHVPGYLGYHFNKFVDNGYMSGGAGYVMSNSALRSMVEKGFDTGACAVVPVEYDPENSEDLEIGKCLNISGVSVLSSLDSASRETFHPYPLEKHLFGPLESYLYSWSMNLPRVGPGCCSRFSISFHYVSPENMLIMDHLLYRTSVYGLDSDIAGDTGVSSNSNSDTNNSISTSNSNNSSGISNIMNSHTRDSNVDKGKHRDVTNDRSYEKNRVHPTQHSNSDINNKGVTNVLHKRKQNPFKIGKVKAREHS